MVRLIGWRGLGINEGEEQQVHEAIERHVHRLSLLLDEVVDVSIHVKQASKQGNKHRYEVHLTVLGNNLHRAEKTGWDLRNVIERAFESIEAQAERRPWQARYSADQFYPEPLGRL